MIKFNSWYGRVKEEVFRGILRKIRRKRCQRVARFKLGNEMRGERYWEMEEVKKCRMYGWKRKDWEHVWEECWSGGRANCGRRW